MKPPEEPRSQRWLGGSDSWRRIILTGVAGGIALAVLAMLVSNVCGGGSGSLDEEEPTAVPTVADVGPGADLPADVPTNTEAPVFDTPVPTVTEALVIEATVTAVATPLPTKPLATETALLPTGEPADSP